MISSRSTRAALSSSSSYYLRLLLRARVLSSPATARSSSSSSYRLVGAAAAPGGGGGRRRWSSGPRPSPMSAAPSPARREDPIDGRTAAPSSPTAALPSSSSSSSSSSERSVGPCPSEGPRTSVLMELTDRVGVLHDVLRHFWKRDVNVTRIESRPASSSASSSSGGGGGGGGEVRFDFFVDFDGGVGDPNVDLLLSDLRPVTSKLSVLDEREVVWFPRRASELDLVADRTLDAGVDLESDHPGFNDVAYRERRGELARSASEHRWDTPIGRIEYTEEETATWRAVWERMEPLWEKYACEEYMRSLEELKEHCGYSPHSIPQQSDVSSYLHSRSGFRMRPVPGLLSSRDFLNGLAFRVFFSTQYIRHHSRPLYTPEPDICHELLGHAPMFADVDFADFSQEIGLASLGASDSDVERLARCYWHSVEFGLCLEGDGQRKAYGAGLLSSYGELEYACSPSRPGGEEGGSNPEIRPWDPCDASSTDFPITTYQPVYFVADSLRDAKGRMRRYCEDMTRPFHARHDARTDTIYVDRPVRRTVGAPEGGER